MARWTIVSGLGPGGMGEIFDARETRSHDDTQAILVRTASRRTRTAARRPEARRRRWTRFIVRAFRRSTSRIH
jgi:hypothetical protein